MQVHSLSVIIQVTTPSHMEPWVMESLGLGSHLHISLNSSVMCDWLLQIREGRKQKLRYRKFKSINSTQGAIMFPAHRKSFRDLFGLEILFKLSIWMKPVGGVAICFTKRMNSWNEKKAERSFTGYFPKLLDLKHMIIKLKKATLLATSLALQSFSPFKIFPK